MCLSSSGREDRQCLRVDSGRSMLLTANLHIRFPLLCSTENWDPEEFTEKEYWISRSVSIQERERERQYELVRSDWLATLHLLERHPSSRRSADTVLPFLFQPAHSYTDLITPATDLLSSAGRIYCQNSQPISQSVDHCRAESGNVHLRWQ